MLCCPEQADSDEDAEGEGQEAAQRALSPAERTALVQSLSGEASSASAKCVEALGGLDSEASSPFEL